MITGVVTTLDSIPLIGVDIKVKSTKEVVKSDSVGTFYLKYNLPETLIISAKGFISKRVKIKAGTKLIAINLKLKPVSEEKKYAIGYGHISEENKIIAVSMLDKDDIDFSKYNTVYDILKARFPGVMIVNRSIQIRGKKSFNASSDALVVLDGVIVNSGILASLPTTDIKSINVIKDSGAAIYGAQGANGVVLIETKRTKK